MSEYTFERLNDSNIKDLITLFVSSSKKGVSHSKFIQKYKTGYTGVQALGYLAYSADKEPVGFYGVIPCLVQVNEAVIKIAQATDGLTHPNHQRKGLFTKLVLMTYEWALQENIQFIYGIPNELSFHVYMNRLKWMHLGNMSVYKWKIFTIPFSYFFKRYRQFQPIYRTYIALILLFYKRGSCFLNPNISSKYIGIIRNDEYHNYKNYQKKYLVKINSASVWISIDGAIKIGDIERIDNYDFRLLLRKLKRLAFMLGSNKIVMQYSPNSYWLNVIDSYQKPEVGLPIVYLNLTNMYDPSSFVFSYGDIDTF